MTTRTVKKGSFLPVPTGVNVYDVADLARTAALDFLAGTGSGWSRRDLVLWLAGSYARATAPTSNAASWRRTVLGADPLLRTGGMERVLLATRETVIDLAQSFARGANEAASEMVASGHVVGVRDALGATGYAPVAVPELDLGERVRALVASDYLTRPCDYESLRVCDDCAQVFFEWSPRHHDQCEKDLRQSGVVPRRGAGLPDVFKKMRGG